MSTPTDPSLDELRALQRRAYGRDADIDDDPVAMARLRQLEAELSAARAPATESETAGDEAEPDAAPVGDADPRAVVTPAAQDSPARDGARSPADSEVRVDPVAGGLAGDGTSDDPGGGALEGRIDGTSDDPGGGDADAVAARPWWRRRVPVLWVGSVVVALLLGVGLTLLVQWMEAGRIDVLQEDADARWPGEVFGSRPEGGRQFEEFHGLTVISFPQDLGTGSGGTQMCLYVLTAPDGSGFGGGSCGAGAFPATASMFVDSTSPRELRDRFAEGTALQFVLEEASVHVYAREPGVPGLSGTEGGEGRS
ncbi:hypothetical protein [Microbacterium sp. E-13]|uniref:hypothetical protein n=1 Tax=Microbacterium sp. E-13 TaxID=3404048 RepID=UPI003CECFC81